MYMTAYDCSEMLIGQVPLNVTQTTKSQIQYTTLQYIQTLVATNSTTTTSGTPMYTNTAFVSANMMLPALPSNRSVTITLKNNGSTPATFAMSAGYPVL